MSGAHRKLAARDYKHGGSRAEGFDWMQYRQFGLGLGTGLAVALAVFLYDHRVKPAVEAETPEPRAAKTSAEEAPAETETDPAEKYDFYDMLPKFEVVVPEQERDVRRDLPSVAVTQAGTYVLQVGSYRNLPDAERLRSQLGKQGIDAAIQRVQVDADVWHRVRIGPTRDLAQLNATRRELRKADIDTIVIRLGD